MRYITTTIKFPLVHIFDPRLALLSTYTVCCVVLKTPNSLRHSPWTKVPVPQSSLHPLLRCPSSLSLSGSYSSARCLSSVLYLFILHPYIVSVVLTFLITETIFWCLYSVGGLIKTNAYRRRFTCAASFFRSLFVDPLNPSGNYTHHVHY